MDRRFKWPVNQKGCYADQPYYHGGARTGGGGGEYGPNPNKGYSRPSYNHNKHISRGGSSSYHHKPPHYGRGGGGAMAPPASGTTTAANSSSDVITLIVENNNLKRMMMVQANLIQEQTDTLSARDQELVEHNDKLTLLYTQNEELKEQNMKLEDTIESLRKQLRLQAEKSLLMANDHNNDNDHDNNDDDTLPPPTQANILCHAETQTTTSGYQTVHFTTTNPPQHNKQTQMHPSELQVILHHQSSHHHPVELDVPMQQQIIQFPMQDHHHHHHHHHNTSKAVVTSVTELPPSPLIANAGLPHGAEGKARSGFNGKKITTVFLNRVDQESRQTSNHHQHHQVHHDHDHNVQLDEVELMEEACQVEVEGEVEYHDSLTMEHSEIEVITEEVIGAVEEVGEKMEVEGEGEEIETENEIMNANNGHIDHEIVIPSSDSIITMDHQFVTTTRTEDESQENNIEIPVVSNSEEVESTPAAATLTTTQQDQQQKALVWTHNESQHGGVAENFHPMPILHRPGHKKTDIRKQRAMLKEQAERAKAKEEEERAKLKEQEEERAKLKQEEEERAKVKEEEQRAKVKEEEEEEEEEVRAKSKEQTKRPKLKEEDEEEVCVKSKEEAEHSARSKEETDVVKSKDEAELKAETTAVELPPPIDKQPTTDEDDEMEELRLDGETTEDEDKKLEKINHADESKSTANSVTSTATTTEAAAPHKDVKFLGKLQLPTTTTTATATATTATVQAHKKQLTNAKAKGGDPLHLSKKHRLAGPLSQKYRAASEQGISNNRTLLDKTPRSISFSNSKTLFDLHGKLMNHLNSEMIKVQKEPVVMLNRNMLQQSPIASILNSKPNDNIFPRVAPSQATTPITPATTPTPTSTPQATPTKVQQTVSESKSKTTIIDSNLKTATATTTATVAATTTTTAITIQTPLTPQSMSNVSSSSASSSSKQQQPLTTTSTTRTSSSSGTPHTGLYKVKTTLGHMLTESIYTTRAWEDQEFHCDQEFFLEEANELFADDPRLQIPNWLHRPLTPSVDDTNIESITDADFEQRHEKYVQDEIKRKRLDERDIRDQIRIEGLRKRHNQDEVVLPLDPLPKNTFYPLPEDIEEIMFVRELPVQAFGENVINPNSPADFSLPWLEAASAKTWIAQSKALAAPVATLATLASKKLQSTEAEKRYQEMNSSFVFLKRRKRQRRQQR